MAFRYFSRNGILLPYSGAIVPLDNIAYQYGFGVYESLQIRKNVLYFAKQHVDRLIQSAKLIQLEHLFRPQEIVSYIEKLVDKNNIGNCNIKILLVGGKVASDSTLFILPLPPLFPYKKSYTHGVTTETVHYERFLPNAKTLNMFRSYIYFTDASKHRNYDVLFLDMRDNILEGSKTNFFAIQGNTLITAPKDKVLEGVTRQTLITIAKKKGFVVKEKGIPIKRLKNYDGAFLTSTSSKIIPVIQVNKFRFPEIYPRTRELMKLYDEFLEKSGGIFKE